MVWGAAAPGLATVALVAVCACGVIHAARGASCESTCHTDSCSSKWSGNYPYNHGRESSSGCCALWSGACNLCCDEPEYSGTTSAPTCEPTCAEDSCSSKWSNNYPYWGGHASDTGCCAFGGGQCSLCCDKEVEGEVSGCSPGCGEGWLDDGECDAACNTAECQYDRGDCSSGLLVGLSHEDDDCVWDGCDLRLTCTGKVSIRLGTYEWDAVNYLLELDVLQDGRGNVHARAEVNGYTASSTRSINDLELCVGVTLQACLGVHNARVTSDTIYGDITVYGSVLGMDALTTDEVAIADFEYDLGSCNTPASAPSSPSSSPSWSDDDDVVSTGSSYYCSKNLYFGSCGGVFREKSGKWRGSYCCADSDSECCETASGVAAGVAIGLIVTLVSIIVACWRHCRRKRAIHNTSLPQAAPNVPVQAFQAAGSTSSGVAAAPVLPGPTAQTYQVANAATNNATAVPVSPAVAAQTYPVATPASGSVAAPAAAYTHQAPSSMVSAPPGPSVTVAGPTKPKFCPSCGEPTGPDPGKFCAHCGAAFA